VIRVRRIVSALLLLAVATSSVEVVFGDRAATVDDASAQVLEAATCGALTAAPADPGNADDCACMCACACAGAQLVVAPAVGPFSFGSFGGGVPGADALEFSPFPSPRPHIRPPLG
jgi:hypothetical protein